MNKAKMRITTLSPEGIVLTDRLVVQSIEFTNGPTEAHEGPLRLEVNLRDTSDIERLNEYLQKLTGKLPIAAKRVYSKKNALEEEPPEQVVAMLEELKEKCGYQDEVISYLRERNFVFMTGQHIVDLELPIAIQPENLDKFQFMIRKLKEGKSVKTDKYDPQLVIGIKITEPRVDNILIYLYGTFNSLLAISWKKQLKHNLKKIAAMVFPVYMTLEEREKWRELHRKYNLPGNEEMPKSKFYLRWENAIIQENKSRKFLRPSKKVK